MTPLSLAGEIDAAGLTNLRPRARDTKHAGLDPRPSGNFFDQAHVLSSGGLVDLFIDSHPAFIETGLAWTLRVQRRGRAAGGARTRRPRLREGSCASRT